MAEGDEDGGFWQSLGKLAGADLSGLGKKVGVYRLEKDGETQYIGRAVEHDNGGFRKRLRDYTRDSDSSRQHSSGRRIHEEAENLDVSIYSHGSDADAAQRARAHEKQLISEENPPWNKQGRSKKKGN